MAFLAFVALAVAGQLAGGQSHEYPIELAADRLVVLEAVQDGVDLVLSVDGPDLHAEIDSPNGTKGPERLLLVTRAAGPHKVTVRTLQPDAAEGKFTLRLVEERAARKRDRQQFEAQQLMGRAYAIRDELRQREALPLAERALKLCAAVYGPRSPQVADALSLRGYLRDEIADYTGGGKDFARAYAINAAALGPDHTATLVALSNLAYLRLAEGRFAEAEKLFRENLARRAKLKLPVTSSLTGLGTVLQRTGRLDEAEDVMRRALGAREGTSYTRVQLGGLLIERGRVDEGEPLCAQAAEAQAGGKGFAALSWASARLCQGQARLARGDVDGARADIAAALELRESRQGPSHPSVAEALVARARVAAGPDAARHDLERALAIRRAIWPRRHPLVVEVERALAGMSLAPRN